MAATGLGHDEIEEFIEEVAACQPLSASAWLTSYLPTIGTIYAMQILNGTYENGGWDIVGSITNALWSQSDSIIQAGAEGFSNDESYHILWQFSDHVTGNWWMAVRENGGWLMFQMDLGNPVHRASFRRGEVPPGVKTID